MKNLKEIIVKSMIGLLFLALIGALSYGAWAVKRKINYSFDYSSQVELQVTEMYEARIVELEKRVSKLEQK